MGIHTLVSAGLRMCLVITNKSMVLASIAGRVMLVLVRICVPAAASYFYLARASLFSYLVLAVLLNLTDEKSKRYGR